MYAEEYFIHVHCLHSMFAECKFSIPDSAAYSVGKEYLIEESRFREGVICI
jgi:hypothetical protein